VSWTFPTRDPTRNSQSRSGTLQFGAIDDLLLPKRLRGEVAQVGDRPGRRRVPLVAAARVQDAAVAAEADDERLAGDQPFDAEPAVAVGLGRRPERAGVRGQPV